MESERVAGRDLAVEALRRVAQAVVDAYVEGELASDGDLRRAMQGLSVACLVVEAANG